MSTQQIDSAIHNYESEVNIARKFGAVVATKGEVITYTGTICFQPIELAQMLTSCGAGAKADGAKDKQPDAQFKIGNTAMHWCPICGTSSNVTVATIPPDTEALLKEMANVLEATNLRWPFFTEALDKYAAHVAAEIEKEMK